MGGAAGVTPLRGVFHSHTRLQDRVRRVSQKGHYGGVRDLGRWRTGILKESDGRELPGVPVDLMTDTPWCDEVQEYVPMDDPARIHLTPEARI